MEVESGERSRQPKQKKTNTTLSSSAASNMKSMYKGKVIAQYNVNAGLMDEFEDYHHATLMLLFSVVRFAACYRPNHSQGFLILVQVPYSHTTKEVKLEGAKHHQVDKDGGGRL
ncbi:hypothetical protein V6N11_039543 [Hibiscus sabdariffa]|uniref:Auxin-responsive protein n=1 Tax=Hibiscus sabdariffa TaxID=183260 RepID=A0ABR2SNZ8_9ROSI